MRPANMAEAIAQLGIDGRDNGDGEVTTLCPLHSDRTPSFAINLESGLWICYAGCGSGNIRQLAAKLNPDWDSTALNNWGRRLGSDTAAPLRAGPEQSWELVSEEHWNAVTIEPPEEYLHMRAVTEQACRRLNVRFNPWNPAKETGQPGGDPCWMIPLRHPEDHTMIGWQTKGTTGDRQALTTGRKGWTLFGIELVERGKDIVIVESPLDVVHALSFGLTNWVATCGSSISIQQLALLAELLSEGGRLIIATDDDEAGDKAAKKLTSAKVLAAVPRVRFAYGDTGCVDPGGMNEAQIWAGIKEAA